MNGIPGKHEFWAKFDEASSTWHPLVAHSADVAAVAVALLERTLLGRRLAGLAGCDQLPTAWIPRLGWLAAIHDFGKANLWFQRQIWPEHKHNRYGHVGPAWDLLRSRHEVSKRLWHILDLGSKDWFGGDEQILGEALAATIYHHGRPPSRGKKQLEPRPWRIEGGVDPLREISRLVDAANRWFPEAFEERAISFPSAPAFWHGWNGLLNLADWLGSTTSFFPFIAEEEGDPMSRASGLAARAVEIVGLDVTSSRDQLGGAPPTFERLIGSAATPRPAQEAVGSLPTESRGSITVLEAPTGEGKTEAALWRFFALFAAGEVDGLYFALPTRTAATQIYRRVCAIVERVFGDRARPTVVQAVPGYISADGVEAERLGRFDVLWPDETSDRRQNAWAAERPKRFLAATVAVGTVDQALLSVLRVPHAHLRAVPLLRHLLVVDEVHASDAYMSRLLEFVLGHHREAGGHALLMSATLGAAARSVLLGARRKVPALEECLGVPYPALSHRPHGEDVSLQGISAAAGRARLVTVELEPILGDPAALAALALEAAGRGARVLVIRNTVGAAVETQQALEALAAERQLGEVLFSVDAEKGSVPTLHHARFARIDRERLDGAIERTFDPGRRRVEGRVAVATQTVQQSLDLDADLLISDLCPLDVLLQRIGRLHRHAGPPRPEGFEAPRCVVAVPASRDIEKLLGGAAHGLGSIYPDLRVIEASWRELEKRSALRVPEDCRELVERTTHPEALASMSSELREAFEKHQLDVFGRLLTDRRLASTNAIDWSKPISEATLGDENEKIRTRLGDEDFCLRLPNDETPVGPFDAMVTELTLRHHQLPRSASFKEEVAEVLSAENGRVTFQFCRRSYLYDRFGLRVNETRN